MNFNGTSTIASGTSVAAPLVAGMMAIACEAIAPDCTSGDTAFLYQAFRDIGALGTVTDFFGNPIAGAQSRFIWQQF